MWWRKWVSRFDPVERYDPSEWVAKDFYRELSVPFDAGEDEIKQAARKLLRQLAPDCDSDFSDPERKFRAVCEANEVLGDPAKRRQYDEIRRDTNGINDTPAEQAAESK